MYNGLFSPDRTELKIPPIDSIFPFEVFMSFLQLGLSAELIRAVSEQGYDNPTPIQEKAIPAILQRQDVLAAAQTGTGKTAGFTLPMLQLLSEKTTNQRIPKSVKALVLTPTRELAAQVYDSVSTYGKHLPIQAEVIFGGVSINPQIKRLRKGTDILVATPGRLLDLVNQQCLNLSLTEFFVLDEADRMLDMGFIHDIRKIIALLPRKRQNLLFSATFSNEIKGISEKLLNDPVQIEVARPNAAAKTVSHRIYPVERERKRELLSFLVGSGNWQQVLVFVRTKHGADRLCRQLQKDGIRSASLHGNKTQHARTKALDFFKSGSVSVLVATDIAARGLDIEQLPHVVNFDLPSVPEDYVHRIGRTGRAGLTGEALSLVSQDETKQLAAIERILKNKIPRVVEPGFETNFSLKPTATPNPNKKRHSASSKKPNQPAGKKSFDPRGKKSAGGKHSTKKPTRWKKKAQ